MAKKPYAEDYENVTTQDERGNEKVRAVYRGEYYEINLDEEELLRLRWTSLLLLAAIISLHTGGGFINNPGMYQFYIALPYAIAFFPMVYLAAGILRLPRRKRKYRRDEIGLSFKRMKTASAVLLAMLGVGVLGEIAFLLLAATEEARAAEMLYLGLESLAALAATVLIRGQKVIEIQPSNEP